MASSSSGCSPKTRPRSPNSLITLHTRTSLPRPEKHQTALIPDHRSDSMVRSNVLLPSSSLRCVSLYHSLDGRTPDILGPTCPPRNRQQSVDRLRPSLHPYRSGM